MKATTKHLLACAGVLALAGQSHAADATKDASNVGTVRDIGVTASNNWTGSANDDRFGEYAIGTWNFAPGDFGLTSVGSITSVDLTLTHNTRSFSSGGPVRFYYSPDDFDAVYTGIAFDDTGTDSNGVIDPNGLGPNHPHGVNPSEYTDLYFLGTQQYTVGNAGTTDTYTLSFTGDALTSLIDQVDSGSDFNIIFAADAEGVTSTYSGLDNGFNPGNPSLMLSALEQALLLGDVNTDGVIDGLDIDPFVTLLTGGGFQGEADLNSDGIVDALDIDPFVGLLSGSGSVSTSELSAIQAVPEPTSALLLGLGGLAVLRRRRF